VTARRPGPQARAATAPPEHCYHLPRRRHGDMESLRAPEHNPVASCRNLDGRGNEIRRVERIHPEVASVLLHYVYALREPPPVLCRLLRGAALGREPRQVGWCLWLA